MHENHTDRSVVRVHHVHGTGHSLTDFLPLIGVLTVVVAATGGTIAWLDLHPMLAFMGCFFLVFGGLKLVRISAFVEAYREYDLLAKRSRLYAYVYPFLEFGFGIAYLFSLYVSSVSAIVVPVMLVGALGVYLKLREKEEIPCACLGTVFHVPMTWVTLGEDLLMAGMAAVLLL